MTEERLKKIRARQKRYLTDPTKYHYWHTRFRTTQQNAKKRNIPLEITLSEYREIMSGRETCVYCELKPEEVMPFIRKNCPQLLKVWRTGQVRLTLDRKDNKVGYLKKNLVVCCYMCNRVKGNNFSYANMKKIGKTLKEVYSGYK